MRNFIAFFFARLPLHVIKPSKNGIKILHYHGKSSLLQIFAACVNVGAQKS